MVRQRFIRVPKDEKAMKDYDYGVQKKEQMEEIILSEAQYKILDDTGVFDKINEKCGIIIDDYEEEVLELDKIPIALEIVNQLINNNENKELIKLKRILSLAITYKTIVGFDF
ncbi:MAG: hypothetical protein HDR22_08570 [Lachnospiraceae bacterium]|nr:hypothetical protein [Lachnospiraceae bacterium]